MMRCLVLLAVAVAGARAEAVSFKEAQGLTFKFTCENGVCPPGPYQQQCPNCNVVNVNTGIYVLQCFCFDNTNSLQDVSTLQNAQNCSTVVAFSNGTIGCGPVSTLQSVIKGRLTSALAATQAPTVPDAQKVIPVGFNFNCFSGSCPAGAYQEFCARCSADGIALVCRCFTFNGHLYADLSVMWQYTACPAISTDQGGNFLCPGASASAGVEIDSLLS